MRCNIDHLIIHREELWEVLLVESDHNLKNNDNKTEKKYKNEYPIIFQLNLFIKKRN